MGRKILGDRRMTQAERQKRRREGTRIVVKDGGAWRLSARGYKRLTNAVRSGQDYDLDALGTFLGVAVRPDDLNEDAADSD